MAITLRSIQSLTRHKNTVSLKEIRDNLIIIHGWNITDLTTEQIKTYAEILYGVGILSKKERDDNPEFLEYGRGTELLPRTKKSPDQL